MDARAPPIGARREVPTISGGSVDFSSVPLLTGRRILVVENDFYLASDIAAAVRNAGGRIVGPFGAEEQALSAIRASGIEAAVLDINLGAGAVFGTPRAAQDARIPFLFLTGYDASVIPGDLASAPVIRKPVGLRFMVHELAKLLEADEVG